MVRPDKPKDKSKLDADELDDSANIYKKWPKDNFFEEDAEAFEEEPDQGGLAGILDHPSYKELEQQLTTAEEKANECLNQQLRLQADLDNLRRRSERDVASAHKFALEKFVNELLPVVDSLERASLNEVHGNEYAKKIHEGIELTITLFLKTLEKFGVRQIDPKHEAFNPELHQAISTQESSEVRPNHVIDVLQRGYTLNDRLIRPALVIVAASN